MHKLLLSGFITIILSACGGVHKDFPSKDSSTLNLHPTEFTNIHSWEYNNFSDSLTAFKKSCRQIYRSKKETALKNHPYFGEKSDWLKLCNSAQDIPEYAAKEFFEKSFKPVLVTDNTDHKGTFTGYYIPELKGSFERTKRFRYPLYAKPSTNYKLPPRSEIVNGALNNIAKPILWVDSEVDSFFLHIQGSGNVRLPNNQVVHVAYAGQNGHKYYAIGRHLIETNQISREKMSAEAIKEWLRNHPQHAQYVMNLNPSYVFFKLEKNQKIAKGAAGVPLMPEYSLAVDDEYYPYGLPIWVETGVNVPNDNLLQPMAFERLMVAQDTGGAIKGSIRGDIFFGAGKRAEIMASEQKYSGRKYLLLPRNAVDNS